MQPSTLNLPTIFSITESEIDLNDLLAKITLTSTGAAAIFTGMVRGVTTRGDAHETEYLEYESYVPMAEAKMKQVADEIREAEGAGKVVTAELRTLLATQAPAARAVILGALPASRPVVAIGHGERVEPKDAKDPAVILRAVKLAKDKNISYGEALSLARGE